MREKNVIIIEQFKDINSKTLIKGGILEEILKNLQRKTDEM